MVDATRDGLPPLTPTDATRTLSELQTHAGQAREAQRERAEQEQASQEQAAQEKDDE